MDKSTIIYLIAIGLFILSKAFAKKKKPEMEQAEGSPFDAIFGEEKPNSAPQRPTPFDEIFESFGKSEPKVEPVKTEVEPTPNTKRSYYTEEIDTEEEAYPAYKAEILDTPDNAIFTPIDRVEEANTNPTLLSVENAASYGAISTPITTFDAETLKLEEEQEEATTSPYLIDFDLAKAVVYAEILKPKFQEI